MERSAPPRGLTARSLVAVSVFAAAVVPGWVLGDLTERVTGNGLLDWLILEFSYLFSVYLRQGILLGRYDLSILNEPEYIYLSLVYSTVMLVVFAVFRFYGSYRFRSFYRETLSLFWANGLGVLFLGTALYLLKWGDFARSQMVFLFLFSMVGLLCKRAALRWMLRQVRRRGRNAGDGAVHDRPRNGGTAGRAAAVPFAEGSASGRGMAAAALCADPAMGGAAGGDGGLMFSVCERRIAISVLFKYI